MKHLNLDETTLRLYCEDIEKKKVKAVNEPKLVNEFLTYIQLHNEHMKQTSAYEIASTIRSFVTWYSNKDKEPDKKHIAQHRDVFYVDLGAYNLKYESGFIHPCIVIRKYGGNAFVVPCSSKKYGKKDDLIFDIKKGGAFRENTGVLLDQARNVSVTRLKRKIGRVEPEVFKKLLDELMRKYFCQKYKDFEDLKMENKKIETQLEVKDKQISELQAELKALKEELIVSI